MPRLANRHSHPALSTAVSFLYPAYASYKALALSSSPHASNVFGQVAGYAHGQAYPGGQAEADRQVERWLMYWTVVGVWTGFEWTGEWLISWYVRQHHLLFSPI